MTTVGERLRRANPVPEVEPTTLSERAAAELTELTGTTRGTGLGDRWVPPDRPARRVGVAAWAVLVALSMVTAALLVVWRTPDPGHGTSDEPWYASTAALERSADHIIRATLSRTRTDRSDGRDETRATATVIAVAHGNLDPSATIEITYTTPGAGPEAPDGLVDGGEYVLLLVTAPDGTGHLVSTIQGYYTISDADRALADADNPVPLSDQTLATLGLA